METTINSTGTKTTAHTALSAKAKSESSFWDKMEFNRFGYISAILVIVGCVGGFAAGFGAKGDALKIGLIAFPTVITLSFMLAVSPMKIIVRAGLLAVLLDLLVLFI